MVKYVLYAIMLTLFIGCKDTAEEGYPLPPDGTVRVNVITPRITTRATEPMPENSTLRLYVYEASSWGTSAPKLIEEKTYRVTANGSTVLSNVNPENGIPEGDIEEDAMHLPAGTYNFYSISPAIKPNRQTTTGLPALLIGHGSKLSLRTTKLENVPVNYTSAEVTGGTPGVYNLRLNTHTLLTSKLCFRVIKGDLLGEVEFVDTEQLPLVPGLQSIAIDNLPPTAYGSFNFKIGDQRLTQMQLKDGRASLGFKKDEITVNDATNPEYLFSFETEVLPCRLLDDQGSPIPGATEDDLANYPGSQLEKRIVELRLHMNVAEDRPGAMMNYKMFTVHLPEVAFLRGKRYNYTLKVDLGGILVASWNTGSNWETVIE